jgi:hypothetical protein
MILSVAGCTTGSLCPRCPYIRGEVLSLYQAEFMSTVGILVVNGPYVQYPWALCAAKHITMAIVNRSMGKVARERWFLGFYSKISAPGRLVARPGSLHGGFPEEHPLGRVFRTL